MQRGKIASNEYASISRSGSRRSSPSYRLAGRWSSIVLPLVFLLAPFGNSAFGYSTADYIDVNGNTSGFGVPSGTINQSDGDWDTSSAGTGVSAAFVSGDLMAFGSLSTDLNNAVFSVNMTGASIDGISVNSNSAAITLTGTIDTKLVGSQSWTVTAGSTLTDNATGVDFGSTAVGLAGGGTINFKVTPTASATAIVTESGTSTVVNLSEATGSSPFAGGYSLTAGTLNFATAASAGAFSGFSTSSKLFTISGGTIDNTSGGPLTLSLGSGGYSIGGSFAFTGTNPLNLGTAAVALTTASTITINSATNALTIGGAITSSVGITEAGSGTLILSGNNTSYSPSTTTTISGGTLQIANTASLGPGSVTIAGVSSLTAGPTLAFAIAGSSSFSNTIVLAGSVATGLTSFISAASADSVTLSGNFSAATGQLCVTGGGTLILSSTSNQYSGGTVIGQTGGSATTLQIASFASVGGTLSTSPIEIDNGTFDFTSTNSGVSTSHFGANAFGNIAANCTIEVANSSTTLTLASVLTGSAATSGFTKSGPGTLALGDANTYSGGTVVSAGALLLSNTGAVQDSVVTLSSGSVVFSSTVSSHAFTFGDISGSGGLLLQDNTTPTANPIALTIGGSADNPTYSGALSGTGSLIKVGAGTTVLTGANTYTGGTTVSVGALQLGDQTSTTAALSSTGGLAVNATLIVEPAAGATITIGNSLTGSGNITVNGSSTSAATPSAAVFNGATTGFTGSWIISGGAIQLGSGNSLGAVADTITVNGTSAGGGELSFTTGTVVNPITINGIGASETAGNLGAIRIAGGTYSGPITLGSNASISAYGSTGTISGSISDSHNGYTLTLGTQSTSTSGGTISITNANNQYSGGTIILGANVGANAVGALGSGNLTVNAVGGGPASVVNINANQTVAGLSGTLAGSASATAATVAIAAGQTLYVNQTGTGTFPGTLSNSGTLQMQGTGTLELTGAPVLNSGSALVVSSGTLRLNNTTTGTGASIGSNATATIASGATLQLAGTVSALSDATTPSSVANIIVQGAGNLLVTGTGQSIGTVIGDLTSQPDAPTTYSGSIVVGDGNTAASLTVTQILEDTLTINAGSTVTLRPSAPLSPPTGDSNNAIAAAGATDSINTSDQTAGADGGPAVQRLESELAVIERLAASDPRLNVDAIENSLMSSIAASSRLGESNANLFDFGENDFASDSNISPGGSMQLYPSSSSTDVSPTAVPEPSTLLLAAAAAFGLMLAARWPRLAS